MSLQNMNTKVISYCELPSDIREDSWLIEYPCDCYVQYSISLHTQGEDEEELESWIRCTYPELIGESFLIHIDY